MADWNLHVHGACLPLDPGGTAAYGIVLYIGNAEALRVGGVVGSGEEMSSNMAVYIGILKGLDFISATVPQGAMVRLNVDSMIVSRQISGRWKATGGKYFGAYKDTMLKLKTFDGKNHIVIKLVNSASNMEARSEAEVALETFGLDVVAPVTSDFIKALQLLYQSIGMAPLEHKAWLQERYCVASTKLLTLVQAKEAIWHLRKVRDGLAPRPIISQRTIEGISRSIPRRAPLENDASQPVQQGPPNSSDSMKLESLPLD